MQYASRTAEFPHESTSDQEFDWEQVESYRQLGFHIGAQLVELLPPIGKGNSDLWSEWKEAGDPVQTICRWFTESWKKSPAQKEPDPRVKAIVDAIKENPSILNRLTDPAEPCEPGEPTLEKQRDVASKKGGKSKSPKSRKAKNKRVEGKEKRV